MKFENLKFEIFKRKELKMRKMRCKKIEISKMKFEISQSAVHTMAAPYTLDLYQRNAEKWGVIEKKRIKVLQVKKKVVPLHRI